MRPVAEGEVTTDGPVDVEDVGALELAVVAVRGAPLEPDLASGRQADAVQRHVPGQAPREGLDR